MTNRSKSAIDLAVRKKEQSISDFELAKEILSRHRDDPHFLTQLLKETGFSTKPRHAAQGAGSAGARATVDIDHAATTPEQFETYFKSKLDQVPRGESIAILQAYLDQLAEKRTAFGSFKCNLAFAKMIQGFANTLAIKFQCANVSKGDRSIACGRPSNFRFAKAGDYKDGAFYFETADSDQKKHCYAECVQRMTIVAAPPRQARKSSK